VVEVNLWSGMRRFVGDDLTVEVEAETIGEMLDALVAAHPALKPVIDQGVSVAVDGEIHQGRHVPIPQGAEVFLMHRLKGG
jgi:molybdopterin synthase sulfur carrier subunit